MASHLDRESTVPGRTGDVRCMAVSNARRSVPVDRTREGQRIFATRYAPGEWGVRLGTRHYPDYATPHPTRWDGQHGGRYLSPDEADELAEHLRRAAAWARAQELVKEHADAA